MWVGASSRWYNKTVLDADFIAEAERLVFEPDLVAAGMLEAVLRRIYATPKLLLERAKQALSAGQ